MNEEEYRKLKKGIEEFGIVEPLVINKDNTLIGGHQRLRALKELGWTNAPVVIVDVDKKKEKALNLALNKIRGDWDYGKLSAVLKELEETEFDIELTGFDTLEAVEIIELLDLDATDGISFGEAGPGASRPSTLVSGNYTIQYTLILNNEEEQSAWMEREFTQLIG